MKYTVEASAHINAPADRVYGIIADYSPEGHPSILPAPFKNLVVEKGGYGAGTVIRFEVHAFGTVTRCRAFVTEPQPGRVLVETNVEPTESPTTFTVVPSSDGGCDVTFVTEATTQRSGLMGRLERFMSARFLRTLYADELKLLAARVVQA